jgi:hypothetical protein
MEEAAKVMVEGFGELEGGGGGQGGWRMGWTRYTMAADREASAYCSQALAIMQNSFITSQVKTDQGGCSLLILL